jgi:hypothetical protein
VVGDRLDRLLDQVEELRKQNALMLQELALLRRENSNLRRKLQATMSGGGATVVAAAAVDADMEDEDPPEAGDAERPGGSRRRKAASVHEGPELPGTPRGGHAGPAMVTDSPAKPVEPEAKRLSGSPQHLQHDV